MCIYIYICTIYIYMYTCMCIYIYTLYINIYQHLFIFLKSLHFAGQGIVLEPRNCPSLFFASRSPWCECTKRNSSAARLVFGRPKAMQ